METANRGLKRKREEEKMSLGTNDSLLGKYALNVELQASGIKVPPFKKSKNQISEHATFVFTLIPDYTSSDPAPITISFSDPAPASLLPPAPTSLSIPHSEPPLAPAGATATATAAFPSAAKNSARDSLASIGSLSDSFGKLLSSTLLSSAPANVSCTSLSIIEPPSISLNDWSMATWYDTKNVSRRPRRNKHSSKSKSLAANSNSLSDSSVMCLKRKREEEKMSLGTNDSLLGKYALNVELQASGIKVPPFKKSKNQISEHATFVFTLIPDYTSSDPAPITISFSDPAPASLLPPAPTSLSIPHSEPPLAPAGATATATAAFPSAAKNSARDSLASIGSLSDSFGKLLSSTLLSSAPANVSCTSLSIIEPPSISLNDWSMATWYDTKNVSRRPRRNKHSSKSKSLAANSNSLSDSSVMYGSCSVKMPSHMSHNLTVTHTYENRARQALSLLKKKFPQPLQEMSPVMQEGRTETYEQRAREALVKLKMSRERQQHNEA